MERYTAKYFSKTTEIIKKFLPDQIVTMQFFQRENSVMLCGMNEVLELLKKHTDISKYTVRYLEEKTLIDNMDVVLELEGNYQEFGILEGIIDGILARQSSIATNALQMKMAAKNKKIVFMGDRTDHYVNQENDGYAVACGGVFSQVTDAQVARHTGKAVGTMPHALIQMFNGDLVAALKAYNELYPDEPLTALVDFKNDIISETVKAVKAFGEKLTAIRIDTSSNMADAMFKTVKEYGVTPNMVKRAREALDQNGGEHVKIMISSGITLDKIIEFEHENAPVDFYGVGGSILRINVNFTCDAVRLNGQNLAKAGRFYREMVGYKVLK